MHLVTCTAVHAAHAFVGTTMSKRALIELFEQVGELSDEVASFDYYHWLTQVSVK